MVSLQWRNVTIGKGKQADAEGAGDEGIAPIETRLRHNILHLPSEIQEATGIVVYGRRIKSLLFSTDIAIIKNCDADAIFCVHPFTAQRAIISSVIRVADAPVFCGAGGGTTQGDRAVNMAMDAENQGAMGVIFNAPIPNRDLKAAARVLDIPIVVTVPSLRTDVGKRIESGATILNVAGGSKTAEIVAAIRAQYPRIPIMASGGKSGESIRATIEAGANAIVYTPPSSGELLREMMDRYRDEL
ncbi:MAG: dioxygenase [Eggerthellaceae bacterium]|nr:dioxygenase [Eggerthellaceae bacterium]